MTARDCGAVGGHMVKRMIEAAERSLSEQALATVQSGFKAGLQTGANQPDKVQPTSNLNLNNLDKMY